MENPPNWSLYVHNFFSVNKLILELKHPGRPISIGHLESPLDCKEIQPVHSEGDQPWDFFGRNNAKAETLVLWPPHAKSWLIRKVSYARRDWGQEEKGTTEDEMAGWHLTRWTWVWVNSGSWWWTGRPGVLRFTGLQRVGHDWASELNWDGLRSNHFFSEPFKALFLKE